MIAAWIAVVPSAVRSGVPSAADDAAEGRRQLLIWSPVLVILILLAFGAYSLFKRWMNSPDATERAQGFSLSDLRAMHKAGKISDEEFEKTRSMMVAAAKRMVAEVPGIRPRKPDAAGRPAPPGPEDPATDPEKPRE